MMGADLRLAIERYGQAVMGAGWTVRVYPSGEGEFQIYIEREPEGVVPTVCLAEIVKVVDAEDIEESVAKAYAKINDAYIMLVTSWHQQCQSATWKRKRSDDLRN